MENAPGNAFARARPVAAARRIPRPLVLTRDQRDDLLDLPLQPVGAWLDAACAAEARVMTPDGPLPAGKLRAGDTVLTFDDGPAVVRWVGQRAVTAAEIANWPEIGPVEIPRNAFGGGMPRRPLRLSPRMGVLLNLPGGPKGGVLLDARDAVGHAGIRPAPAAALTYVQVLLDRHAIIALDGLAVETFHPGGLAPSPENRHQRAEVLAVFPELEHALDLYGPETRPRAARQR